MVTFNDNSCQHKFVSKRGGPIHCDLCGEPYRRPKPQTPKGQTALNCSVREGSKMNREAFAGLIAEDIEWLMKQPRTLERHHIKIILERATEMYYE